MNHFGFVTINGRKSSSISVFDHGLLYGDGVYDTLRIIDKKAFAFEDHLQRLFESASALSIKIPYSKNELINIIKNTFKKSKLKDAFIRIIITRGIGEQGLISESIPNVVVIASNRKFKPLEKISLTISEIRRIDKNAVNSKIKTLNYINNILAKRKAIDNGFDDAILLNNEGFLTEATTSNLFMVKNGEIITPSSESGILDGITRKIIIQNFKVNEKLLTVEDLMNAEEVFLSGTADFITSVNTIDNHNFSRFDFAEKILVKLLELSSNSKSLVA